MDLSITLKYVMIRAQAEATAVRSTGNPALEFIFVGLLKLAEMKSDDFAPGSHHKSENDADIKSVKDQFAQAGVDTTRTRALMRALLAGGATPSGEAALAERIEAAVAHAKSRGQSDMWAQDMLAAILEKPTDAILQICPLKQKNNKDAKKAQDGSPASPAAKADEMSLAFLPELTNRIRHMRAKLLSTVHGQDHVVHAFSEGMFAAELLAASDEKRKSPRSIFVFAGPPGVGKTFLAEQAADALNIPYKRFDMSSYSDHQAYMGLIGFERSYQAAKPGTLTNFVKENPHSILLFDEIEKAHLNTIQLFLQVLDAGRLHDRYLDEEVPFTDTIIIFTSNAGRSLYEGDAKQNAAGVPRKTLLNALETEKNPLTDQPFFPAAITSRMATRLAAAV